MTRLFVLNELIAGPGQTPFSSSPSFDNEWWTRPDAPRYANVRYFVLKENGAEVTRLRVFDPSSIQVALEDFDASLPTIEVDRIETRVERRCQGLGVHALNLLRESFDTFQVVAFSHKDEFWRETGFEPKRYADGRARDATVFVAAPLR